MFLTKIKCLFPFFSLSTIIFTLNWIIHVLKYTFSAYITIFIIWIFWFRSIDIIISYFIIISNFNIFFLVWRIFFSFFICIGSSFISTISFPFSILLFIFCTSSSLMEIFKEISHNIFKLFIYLLKLSFIFM